MQVSVNHQRILKRQKSSWFRKLPTQALYSPKIFLLIGIMGALGCLFYLWQWSQYLDTGFAVQSLERQNQKLQEQIELLQIEVEFLSRLDRLDRFATQKLRMGPPNPQQVHSLPKNILDE